MNDSWGPWVRSLFIGAQFLRDSGYPFMRIPGSENSRPCIGLIRDSANSVKNSLDEVL